MITVGSAIPAAKAAIVALISTAEWPAVSPPYVDGIAQPQVSYGEPQDRKRDTVIVGDTSNETGEQDWLVFDASRREVFELPVTVECNVPLETCQQSVERVFGLFTVVASLIRAAALTTPKLGVDGIVSLEVRQPRHTEIQTSEGWVTVIESGVRVTAQIAP